MLGIKKLDWYITKKFIGSFLIAMILIIGIVIIFDISEKIDEFVRYQAPLKAVIFDYYLNYIPYFINMFSPLFVFITVILFTSKMAGNSEIIAILSGGVSYRRMLVPYIVSAAIIGLLSLGLNIYIIPKANVDRLQFESLYVRHHNNYNLRDIHFQISPGQFVYIQSFSRWNSTGYDFTIENIENNKLVRKVSAETAQWDSVNGSWNLRKVFIRDYGEGLGDKVTVKESIDTTIALEMQDLFNNEKTVEKLDHRELNDLISKQRMRGDANVMYALIEKNRRIAMPFSALVLTIMGVSLSSKKKRGGIGWNLGIGIGLAFSYILFMRFSEMFVYTGTLPPWIALWIPNLLYSIIAAFLYKIAPK